MITLTEALLFALFTRSALAADKKACPVLPPDDVGPPATHVVLFNGMWTTFADARADMDALRKSYGKKGPNGEHLRYALLYHHSEAASLALVDTFGEMLAAEQDGVLEDRFELFPSAIHCRVSSASAPSKPRMTSFGSLAWAAEAENARQSARIARVERRTG